MPSIESLGFWLNRRETSSLSRVDNPDTSSEITLSTLDQEIKDNTIDASKLTDIQGTGGSSVQFFPDANTGLQATDTDGNSVFKTVQDGTDVGDVIMGDSTTSKYAQWDESTQTFLINGIDPTVGGFGGDGSDGILNLTSGITNISIGTHQYTAVTVASGATLSTNGASGVMKLFCQGDFTLTGSMDFSDKVTATSAAAAVPYIGGTFTPTGKKNGNGGGGGGGSNQVTTPVGGNGGAGTGGGAGGAGGSAGGGSGGSGGASSGGSETQGAGGDGKGLGVNGENGGDSAGGGAHSAQNRAGGGGGNPGGSGLTINDGGDGFGAAGGGGTGSGATGGGGAGGESGYGGVDTIINVAGSFDGSSGTINLSGGNGDAGGAGGSADAIGGGGGGGGDGGDAGELRLIYGTTYNAPTITQSAGSAGAAGAAGTGASGNGVAGSAGGAGSAGSNTVELVTSIH